jgi:hypothetical protein
MSIVSLFRDIESPHFSAKVNLASNKNVFYKFLDTDPAVCELIEYARKDKELIKQILSRIEVLSNYSFDIRYENPFDASMAAYGWVLYNSSKDAAKIAAGLLSNAKQIWWTRELILKITSHNSFEIDDTFSQRSYELGINKNVEKRNLQIYSSKLPTVRFFASYLRNVNEYLFINNFKQFSNSAMELFLVSSFPFSLEDKAKEIKTKNLIPQTEFIFDGAKYG